MSTPRYIIGIVVGSLCACMLVYVCTLAGLVWKVPVDAKALEYLKDAGLIIIGAVGGILAKTSSAEGGPTPVEVVNTPQDPANVTEQPKPNP